MSDQWPSKQFNSFSSPTLDGSNIGRSSGLKGDRTRRSWSDKEEETLIMSMKELVANGWKSDNGFRVGYLKRIEEDLKRQNPNTDLKVHPHIWSKITTWKKNYVLLSSILNRSGVGFNERGDYKIECDEDQWAQIIKADGSAKYMRGKSWPHFDAWKIIYGKDRAIGGTAEDAAESTQRVRATQDSMYINTENDYHPNMDGIFVGESVGEGNVPIAAGDSDPNSPSLKKAAKKRKAGEALDGILEMMNRMNDDTNERLRTLSARIGYEFDLTTKREAMLQLLGVVQGLTKKQKFSAAKILVKETELLDLFRGMDEADRPDFVMFLLEENNLA
ncbi:hypothetical protein AAHA92_09050 [Salvia divinorum]|uniref:Myb/SANT-like domain-containing protein n=1 Tax=Salvia divinorum TaxID=28513 RepID=A0ABD1HQ94_SALDI